MLIQANSSDSPVGGGNWLFTSPWVRLGPNAPPPIGPGVGFVWGLVGSKYDQPRVWQRAQLFMNSSGPSEADCVVRCHDSATPTCSCFCWMSLSYVAVSLTLAAAASAWAAASS